MRRPAVTPENVCDAIAKAQRRQPGAPTPDETEVAELTRWINIFLKGPWKSEDIALHHNEWKNYQKEQDVIKDALQILRNDLAAHERCLPIEGMESAYERGGARLRVAVEVLEERCATPLYNPPGFEPRMRGDTPKPQSVMTRVLAFETVRAVRAAQTRMGRSPQKGVGDRDGPVVRTVQFWIKRITGTKPSEYAVLDAVAGLSLADETETGGF